MLTGEELEARRELLADSPRHLAVLNRAAEEADYYLCRT